MRGEGVFMEIIIYLIFFFNMREKWTFSVQTSDFSEHKSTKYTPNASLNYISISTRLISDLKQTYKELNIFKFTYYAYYTMRILDIFDFWEFVVSGGDNEQEWPVEQWEERGTIIFLSLSKIYDEKSIYLDTELIIQDQVSDERSDRNGLIICNIFAHI